MKNSKETVDYEKLNEVISLSKKILKIVFIVLILGAVFLAIYLCKELRIFELVGNIFTVLSPLFIGIVVAWLLDPLVTWLSKKKVSRGLATTFVFFFFILIVYIILRMLVPILYTQINELVTQAPSFFLEVGNFIHEIFQKMSSSGIDLSSAETNIYNTIENLGTTLTTSLPGTLINTISSLASSIGTFVIGLVVAFYLLVDFQNVNKAIEFVPKKYQEGVVNICKRVNGTFRDYVQGLLLIALIVALISTIGYTLVGLPSPLLFGILCAITNIIPYIGPWIGGAICVVVGFTISPLVGILTIVVAVAVQQIDNAILEPLVYSKKMRLHPVTIMLGLLIFGYFFGVLGMILATPILSGIKLVFNYYDEKYEIKDMLKGNVKVNKNKLSDKE